MNLPEGTLTFLFPNIQGSTRLWELNPTAMSPTLAWHDLRMRESIAAHGGRVFKTVGDAFCAVFTMASEAVAAAVQAQSALLAMDADSPLPPLRVRMALHTGHAESQDDDYFGPAFNRCARLLAIGHDGQILISEATAQLAQDRLPPDVSWEAPAMARPDWRCKSPGRSRRVSRRPSNFLRRDCIASKYADERHPLDRLLQLYGDHGDALQQ